MEEDKEARIGQAVYIFIIIGRHEGGQQETKRDVRLGRASYIFTILGHHKEDSRRETERLG